MKMCQNLKVVRLVVAAGEEAEVAEAGAGAEHLVDNTCPGSYLNRQHLYRSYNNHQGLQNLED